MSRSRVLFLVAIGLVLAVHPMLAANYAVGTCKPSLPSFATISAAVSTVPPNSTVMVCPGTYPEQVTITYPLTLKGITSANAGQVVIAVPGSGLAVVTTGSGYPVAPQVDVTAGPVNISDITVDGTGANVTYPPWLVGILYDTGSSGTVNEVTARNQSTSGSGAGVGVWADNASGTSESVTIENSSFHDIQNSAVVTVGSNLLATVKANTMATAGYSVQLEGGGSFTGNVISGGIYPTLSGPSAISANTVTNSGYGMYVTGPASAVVTGNTVINSGTVGIFLVAPVTASHNTVANSPYGIVGLNGATATSNRISNASYGIFDEGGGNTYKSNAITEAGIGIEFNCNSPSVVGNTINDATTGLDNVPLIFSSANSFDNVVTLRTDGCSSGPIHGPALPAAHSGPVPVPAR
jgi:parallel beta-helix repeat protein